MRLAVISLTALALLVSLALPGRAQAGDVPATLSGAKVIAADDVAKAQSAGATVIDARVA